MLLVAERLKKDREREMRRCRKEGKAEGKKEGINENTIVIAKKMLREGLDINLINKITGLDKKTIEKFI